MMLHEKNIRVVHFSSVHKTNDIRVFEKQCRSLAGAGYSVTLIACDGKQTSLDVNIMGVKEKGGRLARVFYRAFYVFKLALRQNADVYHFHDPELLPYGIFIKYLTNSKVVYDSHECYPEDLLNKEWLPVFIRRPIATIYRLLEDYAAKRIDLVVAATPYIGRRFKDIAKQVVTVNNYPRVCEFTSILREDGGRDGVCYVGAISLIRGIIPFLDSLDDVPVGIKVYIAGTFANDQVQIAVTSHRNWSRVNYFGQVGRDKILDIYKMSFAGIVNFLPAPNHEYSQPNKLFEYMAAGIPVICSNFPLWVQIIESSRCGLAVRPDSAAEIAKAINLLSSNSDDIDTMGANGMKAIESTFSWEHEEIVLLEAYSRMCGAA